MADFNHPLFSWIIGIVTIVGIIAVMYLAWRLSHRKKNQDGEVETMGHVWDENLEEYNNPLPRWWLNMFYLTCFWGLGYLIFFPGLGAYEGYLKWTSVGQYEGEVQAANDEYGPIFAQYASQPFPELINNEEAMDIGSSLYATYCTTCHGSDARGARGYPNLRDADWLYGGTPEAIKTTILNGRSGAMPPWGEILDYKSVFNVTAYVRSLSGQQVDAQVALQGKEVYDTNCAMCHGQEGGGNPLMGAPNLTDDIWLYGGSTKKITESIEKGRNGVMPAHGEFLGEDKVHILSAYIYSFTQQTEN